MKTNDLYEKIEVPANLENKLSNLIDQLEREEKQSKQKAKQRIVWLSGIAASVAILFSIGFLQTRQTAPNQKIAARIIEIEDPELAYIEAQKALMKIAVNFNKGIEQLDLLSDNLKKTNNILNKTLKQ